MPLKTTICGNAYLSRNKVLQISRGIEYPGVMRWELFACLICAWLLVYFATWKSIKSSAKVSMRTRILLDMYSDLFRIPVLILGALLHRNISVRAHRDSDVSSCDLRRSCQWFTLLLSTRLGSSEECQCLDKRCLPELQLAGYHFWLNDILCQLQSLQQQHPARHHCRELCERSHQSASGYIRLRHPGQPGIGAEHQCAGCHWRWARTHLCGLSAGHGQDALCPTLGCNVLLHVAVFRFKFSGKHLHCILFVIIHGLY